MKPAFHYEFIAKIIKRRKEDGEYEFIETTKEFYDEEPIKAREAAFKFYQNYIEVLLEAKGLKYESDRQARMALKSFYNPNTERRTEMNGDEFSIDDSLGNGFGVFIVIDNPIDYDISEKKKNMESFIKETDEKAFKDANLERFMEMYESIHKREIIHDIGFLSYGTISPESRMVDLEREIEYYNHFKYDKKGYATEVVFCNSDEWLEGYRDDEPSTYTILKTPFDWTGLDEPYWWGEPSEEDELHEQEPATDVKTWEEIIAGGENNQVEFKPALLYNHLSKKAGISIKGKIAKSICGFLNARGGFLFIGMNDDGTPQGLSHDFSLAGEKAPKDYFSLQFDDTIKQFLPESIPNINGQFITIEDIEIFVVIVFPSKTKPVFMKGQYGKEFWVRWTASTRPIVDIEKITNYCLEHWGNKT